jgi:ABC-type nitrate/sulfonate/bicarbonate transport system permease component
MKNKRLRQGLVVASILVAWELMLSSNAFIPLPSSILSIFFSQIQEPSVQEAAFKTTYRVYISAFIALILGVIIGTLDYFSDRFSDYINSFFYPTQFVSEAVLTLLAITFIGLSNLIIYIITVIAILPDIFVVVQVGLNNIDEKLTELGEVYSDGKIPMYRHIVIPQLLPYILSGFLRAHATAWDIVATVEIFLIAGGLGELTQNYYQILNLPKLFSIVAVILILGLSSDRVFRIIKSKIDKRYKANGFEDKKIV